MQLKRLFQWVLSVSFFLSCPLIAGVKTNTLGNVDIHTTNDIANYTVLKTLPVSQILPSAADNDEIEITSSWPLRDAQRGIYETSVPGIGFSLCNDEDRDCLIPAIRKNLTATGYRLRIYKTGELKGGFYTLGRLITLTSAHQTGQVVLPLLTLHNQACVATRNSVNVSFPRTTLSQNKIKLAEATFELPVTCHRMDDYRNVMIAFEPGGKLYNSTTLETNLKGLGIRLYDATGKKVDFGAVPVNYENLHFRAELIHLPGKKAEAGFIDTSAVATVTMR